MVNTIVEHHSIILMQLLIISDLKSVSQYVSYREASIVIRIVSWGECIVAALVTYILPSILKAIWSMNILILDYVVLGIMDQCDSKIDHVKYM